MSDNAAGPRARRASIEDTVRPSDAVDASKLPAVIVFVAAIGAFPVAYALDAATGIGWLAAAFGALAIWAILAASACAMIRR